MSVFGPSSPARLGSSGGPVGLLLLLAAFWASACRGGEPARDPSLLIDLGISPTPPMVGPAQLAVTLQDTTGVYLEGAEIIVRGDMTHAGMTPVIDTARARTPGHYLIEDFPFTMGGDWVLTVDATLPDGRRTTLRRSTTVLGPPEGGGGVPSL